MYISTNTYVHIHIYMLINRYICAYIYMGSIIFLGNLGNVYAHRCGLIRERDPKKYILFKRKYMSQIHVAPMKRYLTFFNLPLFIFGFTIHGSHFMYNLEQTYTLYRTYTPCRWKNIYIQWDYIYSINNAKHKRVPFIFQLHGLPIFLDSAYLETLICEIWCFPPEVNIPAIFVTYLLHH